MSKATFDAVFAPIEAHYKNAVITQTFGHLYPDKTHYKGKVIIAIDYYNSQGAVILDEKDMPQASPWWYDAITDFAFDAFKDVETGAVFEVDIEVDIVQCVQELEDWEAKEYEEAGAEPDKWSEIHIKELNRKVLVKGY